MGKKHCKSILISVLYSCGRLTLAGCLVSTKAALFPLLNQRRGGKYNERLVGWHMTGRNHSPVTITGKKTWFGETAKGPLAKTPWKCPVSWLQKYTSPLKYFSALSSTKIAGQSAAAWGSMHARQPHILWCEFWEAVCTGWSVRGNEFSKAQTPIFSSVVGDALPLAAVRWFFSSSVSNIFRADHS